MLRTVLSLPGDQPKTLSLITVELGGVGKQARAESRPLPFYFSLFSLVSSPHLSSFIEENKELTDIPASHADVCRRQCTGAGG